MAETTTTFGEWLRNRRLDLRLKSKEVAGRARMTPQEWSDLENDRSRRQDGQPRRPQLETMRKIAEALETSLEVVMAAAAPEGAVDASDASADEPFDDEKARVFGLFDRVIDRLPPVARAAYIRDIEQKFERDWQVITGQEAESFLLDQVEQEARRRSEKG